MDVTVIGAGPAGNFLAYELARKGAEVDVFDRKREIGLPIQCTGILSDYFERLIKPSDEFVVNTVDSARIFSPNGDSTQVRIKKNYVVCRKKFDSYLAGLAESQGARFHLGTAFKSFKRHDDGSIDTVLSGEHGTFERRADALVGADGPLSPVAKSAEIFGKRKFVLGTQVKARLDNDNTVEFYPYMGSYAWVVPEDEKTVRIGLADYGQTMPLFRDFMEKRLGPDYESKIIENQSGTIPIFNPWVQAQKDNIYLTGDAATFVKATTGGGINQSIKAGGILADSILEGRNYNIEWKRHMLRDLYLHLRLHKAMRRFSDSDWNSLIDIFKQEKMKRILYDESRDKPSKMLLKIAAKEPRLLAFARHVI